jgi:hypothetical protein
LGRQRHLKPQSSIGDRAHGLFFMALGYRIL